MEREDRPSVGRGWRVFGIATIAVVVVAAVAGAFFLIGRGSSDDQNAQVVGTVASTHPGSTLPETTPKPTLPPTSPAPVVTDNLAHAEGNDGVISVDESVQVMDLLRVAGVSADIMTRTTIAVMITAGDGFCRELQITTTQKAAAQGFMAKVLGDNADNVSRQQYIDVVTIAQAAANFMCLDLVESRPLV